MAGITLDKVRKVYAGGVEAVRGVSLDVKDGEFVVLVGPSGCGKSTLLRMVAGLEAITDGTVSIAGKVVNDKEPADRDIAMVFQNYALYPHMTVKKNLTYGLTNRRTPPAEIERRVAETARILEIEALLDRKPRQLSGGQRQRVAMGRAIVREPAAFLFDEPLSNLDAKLRVQMRVEIRRLQRALGTTSLYVTHDQMEAMTLADRLVVLNAGQIEQVGTPIDLYERPATLFVAGFIGSPGMNLLPGTRTGGRIDLAGAGTLAALRPGPDGPVTVGLRPEDIRLDQDAAAASAFHARVTVSAAELVGAESYVHGDTAPGKPLVFRVAGRTPIRPGDRLSVIADAAAVHVYGGDGRREEG